MMTYWQYLLENPFNLIACLIFGSIFGLFSSFGNAANIKERLGHVMVGILCWMVIMFPVMSWMEYSDYKKHYTTCEKPVAKRAGYIFSEDRCWKPTNTYVKVNDTTKTKQELLDAE